MALSSQLLSLPLTAVARSMASAVASLSFDDRLASLRCLVV